MDPESGYTIIGYTSGLIVILLLLFIFLLIRRQLPGTCGTCVHVRERPGLLGYEKFCKQECMYNPPFRGIVGQSLYEKREDE